MFHLTTKFAIILIYAVFMRGRLKLWKRSKQQQQKKTFSRCEEYVGRNVKGFIMQNIKNKSIKKTNNNEFNLSTNTWNMFSFHQNCFKYF